MNPFHFGYIKTGPLLKTHCCLLAQGGDKIELKGGYKASGIRLG